MKKITCLLIILCVFLVFAGCKKEQAPLKKPMAGKIQLPGAEEVTKEPEEAKKIGQEVYTYDSKGRRDPFLSLVTVTKQKPGKKKGASPFESYGIDEITLLAIAWDDQKYYALIMLPDNKSFTITEGMTLGLYGGKVQKITEDKVVIREYIKDFRGDIKPKDSILILRKEEE
ncbi:MAG: pilus assembly protein PilP [Thermodesulfovibrionales bacterium]|nr:pilus assembly protein PilP [Thermodesulfovibrionales bacterium]